MENFFEGESCPDFLNKTNLLLISLEKSENLKKSILIPLLNSLYIKSISSPTKKLKEALNFFHYTDRVIQLKKENKFLELKQKLRNIIISNELYDLKFSTLFKILRDYNSHLSNFQVEFLVFEKHPEEPKVNKKFQFLDYLAKISEHKNNIEKLLLTFGPAWFRKSPDNLFLDLLPMKGIFFTGILMLLNKIFEENKNIL